MPNKSILLNQLIRIELFNLKNICPLVYKSANTSFYTPLEKYSIESDNSFINMKEQNNQFIPINTIVPIDLSCVYFVNGYNKHISLKEHISKKYRID